MSKIQSELPRLAFNLIVFTNELSVVANYINDLPDAEREAFTIGHVDIVDRLGNQAFVAQSIVDALKDMTYLIEQHPALNDLLNVYVRDGMDEAEKQRLELLGRAVAPASATGATVN